MAAGTRFLGTEQWPMPCGPTFPGLVAEDSKAASSGCASCWASTPSRRRRTEYRLTLPTATR